MMLGLYLFTLLFGGLLIGVSLLLGGHDVEHDTDATDAGLDHDVDAEADADVDLDHDHDHDHDFDKDIGEAAKGVADALRGTEPGPWLPFLSIRFWTFSAAAFGLTGLLLTLFGIPEILGALIAAAMGLSVGLGAAWVFRQIKTDTVSGDVDLRRLIGQEARVLLPVRPGDMGKVVVRTMGGHIELLAITRDTQVLEPGSTVLIAHVDKGVADVTSLPGAGGPGLRNRQSAAT